MGALKILVLVILISLAVHCSAQRTINSKSEVTRSRHANAAKVTGNKARVICPVFDNDRYPYQGLGLKLGDPFAITYKFYVSKNFAMAVDFGKPATSLYNKYFRGKFTQYAEADTVAGQEDDVRYLTHKVRSDLVGDVKFLYHLDAKKVFPGLEVYLGAGWQWRSTKLKYEYLYRNDLGEELLGNLNRSRLTMGPELVVGIEYAYFQIPVSAFMEFEYFTDVQADPGWQNFEGGIGLRYIF